jgi:hypothetical protein
MRLGIGIGLVVASLMSACGGPVLQNVPAPNKAVVAGAAAATAAAVTLADPDFAAANANREREAWAREPREPDGTKESAPADVLDRLDAAERDAKEPGYGAPSRTQATEPAPSAAAASSPFFPSPSASAPSQPQPAKKSPFTPRWGKGTVPVDRVPPPK